MEEHIASGILTAKTHWRDYHSKVYCPLWLFVFMFLFSVFCVLFYDAKLKLSASLHNVVPLFLFSDLLSRTLGSTI